MPFLYGNHVVKAHLGRVTEDTPEHQGVVVYNMNDIPLVRSWWCCTFYASRFERALVLLQGLQLIQENWILPRSSFSIKRAIFCLLLLILSHPYDSDVGEYLRDEASYLLTAANSPFADLHY